MQKRGNLFFSGVIGTSEKTSTGISQPVCHFYLFIDRIKVTIKTADTSIKAPAAINPKPIKTMAPRLA